MPISMIRICVLSPVAMNWLETAVSPKAVNTEVSPSSTGMPAASSAPKASSRMISVIGTDRNSAFWKSCLSLSSNRLPDEASPNCSTRRPGWSAATAFTAASIGTILSTAFSESPRMSKRMSAARPSCERSGTWMFVTVVRPPTRSRTSAATAFRSALARRPLRV